MSALAVVVAAFVAAVLAVVVVVVVVVVVFVAARLAFAFVPPVLLEFASPPQAEGVRLLPPGDPYLQKPNRPLLAPDQKLRSRLFRPVASPGAVLRDGRLAGLWRAQAKGKKVEISVEKLVRLARKDLDDEAQRVADARGAADVTVAVT